jgi:hypothetical protein
MLRKNICISAAACIFALAVACGRTPETPVAPSGAETGSSDAAADGSTLKVTAPTPKSPVNGEQPDGTLVLTAGAATGKFANVGPLSYRFQIINGANATVCNMLVPGGDGDATVTPSSSGCSLDFDVVYSWQVRGEMAGGAFGPWSSKATFRSPVGGYIKGNELFDPLTNGQSAIVSAARDVTWLPGKGVRLESRDSYVEWRLQQPCIDCEFSALMTNLGNGSEEWKTKVMSMLRGDGVNTTENAYRVTIDKRTTWVGQGSVVRYTMRSRGVDAGEPKSPPQSWNRNNIYFWKFTWAGGNAVLLVKDGGINGSVKTALGTSYKAPYSPDPHLIRLGSVGGRADNESNPGTIVWNVWVSPNPRPNLPGDQ